MTAQAKVKPPRYTRSTLPDARGLPDEFAIIQEPDGSLTTVHSNGLNWMSVLSADADGISTHSVTFAGSGIEVAETATATVGIAVDGGPVSIARVNQVNNYSTANITGGGHIVAGLNFAFNACDVAKTLALAIGGENTVGFSTGTVTRANSSLNTINQASSGTTTTLWTGATSCPTNVAAGATITKGEGFRAEVTDAMLGTLTEWNGFYNADISGVAGIGGITTRYAFVNADPGAVFKSATPFCDKSFVAYVPTNGGTTNVAKDIGLIVLNSGGAIASTTLALANNCTDGQKMVFFSVYQITALTVNSSGVTMLGAPSTILASGYFTMQYAASGPYWIRIA